MSNVINHSTDDGIYGGSNNYILDNIIFNSVDDGIYFYQQSNNTIQNNSISYCGDTAIETKYLSN